MLLIAAVSLWCWAGSLPREDAKSGGPWLAATVSASIYVNIDGTSGYRRQSSIHSERRDASP
jgi:hypothetical protein